MPAVRESPLWVKAEMRIAKDDVCFTPESRHQYARRICLLRANSGHQCKAVHFELCVAVAEVASPLEAALGFASNVEMVSDPDLGAASIRCLAAFPVMTNDKRNVSICLRSCSSDRNDWA